MKERKQNRKDKKNKGRNERTGKKIRTKIEKKSDQRQKKNEGSDRLSDSLRRCDQSLGETSGADQRNQRIRDFIGPFHWFPVATHGIAELSPKVDRGLE